MLYYRKQLYDQFLPEELWYTGKQIRLDLKSVMNQGEDTPIYAEDVTSFSAGLELHFPPGGIFPPPIMKTVEVLAHPNHPNGVPTEILHFQTDGDIWIPYHATILHDLRPPLGITLRPGVQAIYSALEPFTGYEQIRSSVEVGLFKACEMPGLEEAFEGISYFLRSVPHARDLLRTWSSDDLMLESVMKTAEALAKNRDYLNATLVEGAVANLYSSIKDVPIVFRTRDPIYRRRLNDAPISWYLDYMQGDSPVRLLSLYPTETYSPIWKRMLWGIEGIPATDLEVWVTINHRGTIVELDIPHAIDRNIVLGGQVNIASILEGHIRYLIEVLTDSILNKGQSLLLNTRTLHEHFGVDMLKICFIKTHDDVIQIAIYANSRAVVFSMTILSALVKLTDTCMSRTHYLR